MQEYLKTYDAGRFDWASDIPSAEASDLGIRAVDMPFAFGPIYNDAADIGMALRSPTTGKITVWVLSHKIPTPDSEDIGGWEFIPAPETIREFPHLAHRKIIVWND